MSNLFDDYGNLNTKAIWGKAKWLLALFIIIVALMSTIRTIPAGHIAILLQGGKPIGEWGPGFHFMIPIVQSYDLMDTQIQKAESAESTGTSDLQSVTTTVALNFRLNPDMITETFKDFRHDYKNRIIKPAIEESLKACTAYYTAEELITHRAQVKDTLDEIMKERLENVQGKQYFVFVAVSLTDFQFNPSFQDAIEAKVQAQQEALEAENYLQQVTAEAQQMVIKANARKEADIAEAEGEALARVIQANASKVAEMMAADALAYQIELINQKIADNPYYIQYSWIQAWNGALPTTVFGDENIELLLQGALAP